MLHQEVRADIGQSIAGQLKSFVDSNWDWLDMASPYFSSGNWAKSSAALRLTKPVPSSTYFEYLQGAILSQDGLPWITVA